MKKVFALLALAGVASAPPAQAQDGASVFRPTGAWTADFGDDYCRLMRPFSDGKDEVSLALERTQPGAPTRLILVGNGIRTFRGADQIGYAFTPSGPSAKSRYVRSETAEGKQFLSFDPVTLAPSAGFGSITSVEARPDFSRSPGPAAGDGGATSAPGAPPPPYNRESEQETARGINGLALSDGLISPVRFETGALRAPIAAMQTCADDLLAVWGLDHEKHKTLTSVPIPNPVPNGILPQGTIPFSEFGKFGGGANQVRLIIDAGGKPTSCTIYSPSLSQSLNNRICSLLMDKASFQPAKDAEGQAMASYWMGPPMAFGPPFPGGPR